MGSRPLGYCASQVDSPNTGVREQNLLSLSYGNIIQKDIASSDGLLPESFETYNVVEPGDTVLRLTDLQNDQRSLRVGFVKERGIITSAYVTLRPHNDVDPRFFSYVLKSMDFCKDFYALGAGVRQSLKFDELKRVQIHLPNLVTQQAIANFLDAETARFSALIASKRKLLTLLEERLETLLQTIPANCNNRVSIRRLFKVVGGSTPSADPANWDGDVLWATPSDLAAVNGSLLHTTSRKISVNGLSEARSLVPAGSLLVSKRAPIGYVAETSDWTSFSQGSCGLVPVGTIDVRFFRYQLRGMKDFLGSLGLGSTFMEISSENLASTKVAMPLLETQQAVANDLDRVMQFHARITGVIHQQLNKIEELCRALITAAVSGEFEIPEAAA